MRKYRLKKDTPTIKAGTVFQEVTSDYDKSRELVRIMPTSGTTSPQWTIDDINNFDEWFEEVKEFEEWKLKEDENYKRIGLAGSVYTEAFAADNLIDRFQLSIGNCYPTDTPDEVIIKEQRLIPQAMHRLKMAAKKAWFEFDGSEGPDWNDSRQKKFSIKRWHVTGAYLASYASNEQYLGGVYFPTSDSAHYYINNNEDDIELLFGAE